jgi:energy-coupling factor transporter ATP-binding protein EcfA2
MLVSFSVAEYHAIRQATSISLRATSMSEPGWVRVVPSGIGTKPESLVCVVCMFGPNGSGKTTILRALGQVRSLIISSAAWGLPPTFERLPAEHPVIDSGLFEIEFLLEEGRTTLLIEIVGGRIVHEEVHVRVKRRSVLLYRRSESGLELGTSVRRHAETLRSVPPQISLVGYLASLRNPLALEVVEWFVGNLRFAEESNRAERWALTSRLLHEERTAGLVRHLLAGADLGIVDVIAEPTAPRRQVELASMADQWRDGFSLKAESALPGALSQSFGFTLLHDRDCDRSVVPVALDEESAGTHAWLGAVGIIVDTLLSGTVLLADELEASLHPTLVRAVIMLFQSKLTNPLGAQLISNSNDVSLLDHSDGSRVLGRDQIWFCQRDAGGGVRTSSLSSFSVRKGEAVGRRYLDGAYGALPNSRISEAAFADLLAAARPGDPNRLRTRTPQSQGLSARSAAPRSQ